MNEINGIAQNYWTVSGLLFDMIGVSMLLWEWLHTRNAVIENNELLSLDPKKQEIEALLFELASRAKQLANVTVNLPSEEMWKLKQLEVDRARANRSRDIAQSEFDDIFVRWEYLKLRSTDSRKNAVPKELMLGGAFCLVFGFLLQIVGACPL